jgi:hypothetical protein
MNVNPELAAKDAIAPDEPDINKPIVKMENNENS